MNFNKISTHLIIFFATGIYTGYSPIASGTVGTLIGIAVYYLLPYQNPTLYFFITLLCFWSGCWIAHEAEIIFDQKDSGLIVIDEIVGFLVSMFALPATWKWVLAAFFIFRLLDILKPRPAVQCERIRGGLGVMADDLVAGIYTNLILQLIYFISR